jgi:hypothetical protein
VTTSEPVLRLDASFYDLTQEAGWGLTAAAVAAYQNDFGPQDPPPPQLLSLRRGVAEAPSWVLTQAFEFLPQPLTVDLFLGRAVFSSPRLVRGLMDLMASEGWFDRVGDEYQLTPAGRQVFEARRDYERSALIAFDGVPAEQTERLALLLGRVVGVALDHPEVPVRWCLSHSRRRAPEEELPAVVHFEQYCDDLNALRDDAYLSACGKYAIPPAVREPFGLVCAGQAMTAEELFARLAYRGFSVGELGESLQTALGMGLLEAGRDGFVPTEAGLRAIADIEYLTDFVFYAPWSVLAAEEMEEVFELLLAVRRAAVAGNSAIVEA